MEEMTVENGDINIEKIGIDYNEPLMLLTEKKIENVDFSDNIIEMYFKDGDIENL
jgi:hypothetical protein